MAWFDKHYAKHMDYKPIPSSEVEPLVVGMDDKMNRQRFRHRLFHWLFAAVALIVVGQGVFAYMYVRSHVECVPYEGGTTTVDLPIFYRGSAVLLHSSVSSHDVFVTHVERDTNLVTVTLEGEETELDENAEVRLCTLKGGKVTGVGIFAHKKDQASLPVIKSLKVQVPTAIPQPSIDLLPPPKKGCSLTGFLKWVGVWDSKDTNTAKLEAEGHN